MAVVKMKKLRFTGALQNKDAILRLLLTLGCVEIAEPEDSSARLSSDADSARSEIKTIETAIALLAVRVKKQKLKFDNDYSAKTDKYFNATEYVGQVKLAADIAGWDAENARLKKDISNVEAEIETLRIWENLELPLDFRGTRTTAMVSGTVPKKTSFSAFENAVNAVVPECKLYAVSENAKTRQIYAICLRDKEREVVAALRSLGFTRLEISGVTGLARTAVASAQSRLDEMRREHDALEKKLDTLAACSGDLRFARYVALTNIARETAVSRMTETEDKRFTFTGWLPADRVSGFAEVYKLFNCEIEFSDPAPDEFADVPVALRGNALTAPFAAAYERRTAPAAYGGADVSALVALFFVLFYGLMVQDIVFGALLIVASLFVKRNRALPIVCGLSAFVFGVLRGSVFADAVRHIAPLFGNTVTESYIPRLKPLELPIIALWVVIICAVAVAVIGKNAGGIKSAASVCARVLLHENVAVIFILAVSAHAAAFVSVTAGFVMFLPVFALCFNLLNMLFRRLRRIPEKRYDARVFTPLRLCGEDNSEVI